MTNVSRTSLCALVPIYNEEIFLEKSVLGLINTSIFDQIILINDCSTDNSEIVIRKLADNHSEIEHLKTDKNSGKGSALSQSKKLINTSHVVIHDADLEYSPSDIHNMFEVSKNNTNSLILGSRFIGNKERKNIYLRTKLANKYMSLFFSFINNYRVSDVATCYKLMPTKFFLKHNFYEKGFSIEIEMLSKFLKYNPSIIEVPISYTGRSYSEGKKIKTLDGFKYLYSTMKYRFVT